LPDLNAPLVVNSDGTLKDATVSYFEALGQNATDQMEKDGEISASKVTVDPAQDVLTTSQLTVSCKIVPVGVARNIVVNIGFTVSIQ
jgi:hypothetical protein